MTTAFEPYCNEECGRPATHDVPLGMTSNGIPITEWLCDACDDVTVDLVAASDGTRDYEGKR